MTEHAQAWCKRRQIPDAQIQDAADQYEAARKILADEPPGSGVLLPLMNAAAMAIELYLKSLSADLVHTPVEDFPGLSVVTAAPSVIGWKGHKLLVLLDELSEDIIQRLEAAFRTECAHASGLTFRMALEQCEGAFAASRYPFEHGKDVSNYPLGILMSCSEFLARFVGKLPHIERIEWK